MGMQQIIQACKRKDRKARGELYKSTAAQMMNICMRYTDDLNTAKDVFQESYLKVFEKIHQFDSKKGNLMAWMSRIAVNTALEQLRKAKKIEYVDAFAPALHPVSDEDIIADLSATELLDYVNQLATPYKLVFNLYVVEGYQHQEIADLLGITASTSRSQLARARVLLQKIIKKNKNRIGYETA